jgi:hypothetical protein
VLLPKSFCLDLGIRAFIAGGDDRELMPGDTDMNARRKVIAALGCILLLLSTATYAQWLNYPTPGIPRKPDGQPNLTAPTPRTVDGRPDLSGVWNDECGEGTACVGESLFFDLAKDLNPSDVEMTPWASAIQSQRERRDHVDDPYGYCLPPGTPRIDVVSPFKVLQTQGVTAFLHETEVGLMFRQVFTDGRPLPTVTEPSWLGYSVGTFDGDTLVVETTGFRNGGWLDTRKARPHSDALHVTERFRRTDFGHMNLTITIDDPKAFLKPWTVTARLNLLPDMDLIESFCDSHDKTMEHRRITLPALEPPSVALPGSVK